MKRDTVFLVLVAGPLAYSTATAHAETWPCWHGSRGNGTCIEKNVPTKWDPAGALWKKELAGQGHASAIVGGTRVLTVTALPATRQRVLLCPGP